MLRQAARLRQLPWGIRRLGRPHWILWLTVVVALVAPRGVGPSRPVTSHRHLDLAATTVPGSLPPGAWRPIFDDEFSGTTLDFQKWSSNWLGTPGTVTPPVNSTESECYDPSQVRVAHGDLLLSVVDRRCLGRPYASGLVESDGKFSFTYGFVEARIFLPASGGAIANWPAFWADGQNWPEDGELDVMEGLSGSACFHFHDPSGAPGSCAGRAYTGWHVYGADWEPGSVTYYYDGRVVGRITTGVTAAPMYLIVNDAVDPQYGGPTVAPSTMEVDWIRVYQHP